MALFSNAFITKKVTSFKNLYFSKRKKTTVKILLAILTIFTLFYFFSNNPFTHHRKAPFQALLLNDQNIPCSGVLISSQFILTAAHCIYKTREVSILLVDKINEKYSERILLSLTSSNFIIHHNYNPKKLTNDLALIKVPQIPLRSFYIDLPRRSSKVRQIEYLGESVKSFGWMHYAEFENVHESLREMNLVVLKMFHCESDGYGNNTLNNNTQLCLFVCGGSRDVCSGYSGGPILSDDGNVLIGIVSKVDEKCKGRPVIAVKLDYYAQWIVNQIGIYRRLNNV